MSQIRVRFAPSPTGTLHIGSARTALYNYLFARHSGGVMVLRIEDTDIKRSLREHESSITRDLHWLGLSADEGPGLGGEHGPYRQSERSGLYEEGVRTLMESGAAYPCFCTDERLGALKQEQLGHGLMPKYDRTCFHLERDEVERRLEAAEPHTVRFQVPAGDVTFTDLIHGMISFSSDVIGDFIIKRSDGGFSYNYAVVIDDAGMDITHVIRGEDHITNTARQLMLFAALGKQAPAYAHHSLIHAPDGGKLSKRHGATSIGEFRDLGYLPAAVVNYLALLSWHPGDEREIFSLDELAAEFDMARVSKSPASFDLDKLNWLNGLYIRELEPGELATLVAPYLEESGISLAPGQEEVVAAAIQANLVTLADAPKYAGVFVEDIDPAASQHSEALAQPGVEEVLELLGAAVSGVHAEYFAADQAREMLREIAAVCKRRGIKGKSIHMPLRVALSGRDQGPELYYLVAGLGSGRILDRLARSLEFVRR